MIPILLPIGALLTGVGFLLLGTGLLNTLLAVRGSAEGFTDQTLGLLGSAYFAGFIIGTYICPRLIRRMGHIRSFNFFAAATAVCVLLHVLFIDPVVWFLLRVVTGIALVGIYTVIESWLNTHASSERRGQIFAVYMVVNLGALALAQQFLRLDSPMLFTLFAISAICLTLAILPVAITRLSQPVITRTPPLKIKVLWAAAPVAVAGSLLAGLGMGGFWGMGAVYAGRLGMDGTQIASFISLVIVAGALMQWPLGLLSDRIDRRSALAIIAGLAAVGGLLMALAGDNIHMFLIAAAIFGGGAFAVYPVIMTHLIDHLHQEEILSGSAALLLLNGIGSAFGPAVAGLLMGAIAPAALPMFFAVVFSACAAYSFVQSRSTRDEIVEEPGHFVPMVRTSTAMLELALDDQTPAEEREHATEDVFDTHDESAQDIEDQVAR